jgi:GxxExxY protein
MSQVELSLLSERTIEAAIRVHKALGPGLLESAYVACLIFELRRSGLEIKTEVPVPVIYEGIKMVEVGYRIDILVENELVIEPKSLEKVAPIHLAQLTSHLKLSDRRLGLLLNFNVETLRDGIFRRVNRF